MGALGIMVETAPLRTSAPPPLPLQGGSLTHQTQAGMEWKKGWEDGVGQNASLPV